MNLQIRVLAYSVLYMKQTKTRERCNPYVP